MAATSLALAAACAFPAASKRWMCASRPADELLGRGSCEMTAAAKDPTQARTHQGRHAHLGPTCSRIPASAAHTWRNNMSKKHYNATNNIAIERHAAARRHHKTTCDNALLLRGQLLGRENLLRNRFGQLRIPERWKGVLVTKIKTEASFPTENNKNKVRARTRAHFAEWRR